MTRLIRRGPSASSPPGGRAGGRLAVLDGLRIIAALMVVFHHYVGFGGGFLPGDSAWGRPAWTVFHGGALLGAYTWTGFCLFFVISGFVICMSGWGRSLGEFFTSRVMRLYPAYWLSVLATAVVVELWPVIRTPMGVYDTLANLTMFQEGLGLHNIAAVYWTLWIELRFYLLFALVVWGGVTYRRVVGFCLLWLVASLAVPALDMPFFTTAVMPEVAPFFIAGLAFYLMHRFRPNLLLWGIVGFCWLQGMRYAASHQKSIAPYLGRPVPLWPAVVLVTVAFAVMAAVALGRLSGIQWRWLTVAGALTYPLYLLHEEIGWTLIRLLRHDLPPWALVGVVTAGMLVAAWLVHRLVERPLGSLLKKGIARSFAEIRESEGRVVFAARSPEVRQSSLPVPETVLAGSGHSGD